MPFNFIKQKCPNCGGNLFFNQDGMPECLQCNRTWRNDQLYKDSKQVATKTVKKLVKI